MNMLQITSQKTAVLDEGQSRNSIRPVLEQAGFDMLYEPYSRTLLVLDSPNEVIASIIWVKGVQDFERQSKFTPLSWVGSDLGEEVFDSRDMIQSILETGIGTCELRYINTSWEWFSLEQIDKIYTKSPRYFEQVLREYYKNDFDRGKDAIEDSPEDIRVRELLLAFRKKIEYSNSPDTTVKEMSSRTPENIAGWEIVQTWMSLDQLWLLSPWDGELTRKVSTDIYANVDFSASQNETFTYFLEKIKKALTEL